MGTTRIKVIDLSSGETEIKTARKHAEKLAGLNKKEPKIQAAPEQTPETGIETSQEPDQTPLVQNLQTETATPAKSTASTNSKTRNKQKHGAKYQDAKKLVEEKLYSTKEALDLLPKTSFTKFDPSVEAHLYLNEKNFKGSVNFPHLKQEAKAKKYLVFSDKVQESANIIKATEKTISDIESAKLKPGRDFDVVVASPSFMPQLAKVAKVLGPRGMMPNPKNGTITDNPQKFMEESASMSSFEFKSDPSGPVVHVKIGKLSQKQEELSQNLKALALAVGQSKIKKAQITTSMGPAIKLDPATF